MPLITSLPEDRMITGNQDANLTPHASVLARARGGQRSRSASFRGQGSIDRMTASQHLHAFSQALQAEASVEGLNCASGAKPWPLRGS